MDVGDDIQCGSHGVSCELVIAAAALLQPNRCNTAVQLR